MALSSAIVCEIRQGGSDTNGGGFKAGATGTDWSLQNTAQYSVADGVTAGTTTITSATANFGTDVVGNLAYVQGGTGAVAANWYEITVRNSATSITVDRLTGLTAGTGVTLHIGGAFATPGVLSSAAGAIGGQLQSGMKAWWQYNATAVNCSTSTVGPGGPCAIPSSVPFVLEGYEVTRGDRTGNRPTYKWTAAAPGVLTYLFRAIGSNKQQFANLTADANTVLLVGGYDISASRTGACDCVALNATQSTTIGFSCGQALKCQANNCLTGFSGGLQVECDAVSCTTGYTGNTASARCLARSCTTGFLVSSTTFLGERCTADSCTTGFSVTGQGTLSSCLASNCTGTGFALGSSLTVAINLASYNNVSIASGTPVLNEGPFANGNTLTSLGADPYLNQATADFRPNANSPGGAQLRAAGIGVYGQTDNSDIGAVQHTDPTGGAGNLINQGEY